MIDYYSINKNLVYLLLYYIINKNNKKELIGQNYKILD